MKDFIKQYLPYYKNYKLYFFFTFIGILLVSFGTAGTAYIIQPLIDEIFVNKDKEMLTLMPIIIIGIYSAKGFGRYIQAYYISYIGQDIIRRVRDKLLGHILNLDLIFFNSKHGGELISRVINDINRIQSAVSNQVAKLIQEVFTVVALIGVVIYQNAELAFYSLVIIPLIIYPLSRLAKRMKKLSFRSQEKNSDITSHLSEAFNNIEIIKANSTENLETNKFAKHNNDFFTLNMKAVKTNELVSPIMEIFGAVAFAIVVVVGGNQVINEQMTTGTFLSFVSALFMLYTPIKSLSSLYNQFQDALAANERVNSIFAIQAQILSGEKQLKEKIESIEFKNIALQFGEKYALKNINLQAKKGDKIALIGDSGGGKSSLVNTLIRFYDATDGEIVLNNQNIKEFSLDSLRDNIAVVTQRIYIFNDTIGANVAYGQEYNEEKTKEALTKAHAMSFIQDFENGIDTILDEFGTNLSGGQRQRIAIARALYKDPEIFILDEATSALDNQSEALITEILDEITKDKITFVIAHRLSTIKNASKIVVFKDGEIVCKGSESSLLENCEEFQRLHSLANI